jgi:hypothetical protein
MWHNVSAKTVFYIDGNGVMVGVVVIVVVKIVMMLAMLMGCSCDMWL